MRNLKKFLALVMAMVMAMSLMVTANAAVMKNVEYPDTATADPAFDEAITVLSGMGVFSGDNGNFYPTREVTRAEAAALVYRLATGDVNDDQAYLYAKYGNFPDVTEDKWYAGYVGYCANKGLIKGRSDGTFDPSGNVTGYEILAMILRAVGYDQQGEFTGPDWQVNVSALSQKLGVIANVKTTQYGGTLYLPAQRQVVADLLFQTDAYIPMVNYTTAFGYQPYGNDGGVVGAIKNETLGHKIFGLTWHNGVIVGNEVTGETKGTTKIGFSLNTTGNGSSTYNNGQVWIPDVVDPDDGSITTPAHWEASAESRTETIPTSINAVIDDDLTIRDGYRSAYVYASDYNGYYLPKNVTLTFKWDSDLRLFNHKVKVWYDDRSNEYETVGVRTAVTQNFTTNLDTYAVFDKATNVAVVALENTDNDARQVSLASGQALYGAATNNNDPNVHNNWSAPGFKVRKNPLYGNANGAYFNYSFGPITTSNYGLNVTAANSAISPVLKNDETTAWGLYLLISNSADKALDVVIPLDMTMSKIAQSNSTSNPKTVGVLNGNGDANIGDGKGYFDTVDSIKSSSNDIYAEIAQKNLRNSPNTALDTKVAAIEITGTAGPRADARAAGLADLTITVGDKNYGFASAGGRDAAAILSGDAAGITMQSTYYYQLTENKIFKTATVLMINPVDQTLTLSDGTTLQQSIYAEDVDANFTTKMEGVHYNVITGAYSKQLQEGHSYTFTLDEQGHYIYWTEPRATGNFIYGTYIDFHSALASSSFSYPLVYVNANGEAKQQVNITKATLNNGTDVPSGTPASFPQRNLSANAYDWIELNKRDDDLGNTAGYLNGYYIGYALNGTEVQAIGPYDPSKPATFDNDYNTTFYQGAAGDFGATQYDSDGLGNMVNGIMIDEAAEKLGVAKVKSAATNIEYFLSNNTVFYVVDGAGTDNQTVTEYKGLTGLRAGYSNVVIDVCDTTSKLWNAGKYLAQARGTDANSANVDVNGTATGTHPYSMVYYSFGRTDYAQDYLGSAYEIKTVFLPKDALKFTATAEKSLYFVGDNTQTNISVINGDTITQFEMYDKEGNKELIWVDGYIGDTSNSSAWVIDQNGDNVFYELVPAGKATIDGKTIYSVRALSADNAASVIGQYYNGTFTAGAAGAPDTYTATKLVSKLTAAPAVYAPTTTNAQVAYIDDIGDVNPNPTAANLYNVGTAKVVNLNTGRYPGVDSVPTLNNAGSLTDNYGIEVSCVLTAKNSVSVSVIFVNSPNTPW